MIPSTRNEELPMNDITLRMDGDQHLVVRAANRYARLSSQEMAVLKGIVRNHTVRQMSEDLELSSGTVGTYCQRIKSKLQCESSQQVRTKMLESGVVEALLVEIV